MIVAYFLIRNISNHFQKDTKIVNIPITDGNKVADILDKWFRKRWTSINRNNNLTLLRKKNERFWR